MGGRAYKLITFTRHVKRLKLSGLRTASFVYISDPQTESPLEF
jgi:hypothetical protein